MEAISEMVERRGLWVSVVIPAYNEAQNLPYVLPQIPNGVHEVILFNDHSTDDTVEIACKWLPGIRVINTQHGRGKRERPKKRQQEV